MRKLYLVLLFLSPLTVAAQFADTLRVATYNLLYYGTNTSFCTTGNNNVATKNGHFKTILNHIQPHVLGVQEMGSVSHSVGFLQSVLNTDGETRWTRAPFLNTAGSNLVCVLYYDTTKLVYQSHQAIATSLRDIAFYKLYYKQIPWNNDTIFMHFAVMHLKAGSTTADEAQRAQEINAMLTYLNSVNFRGNLVIMGDFNVNGSSEACYQALVNAANQNIRLYDPVNQPGNWSSNASFAAYHTQAPMITGNGCTSGGGLDDRLDHIMINNSVRQDSARVYYIPGSYVTVGNDGLRYNGAVNNPANQQVPPAVANALIAASDHLPVRLNLRINLAGDVSTEQVLKPLYFRTAIHNRMLRLWIEGNASTSVDLVISDVAGRMIKQETFAVSAGFETSLNLESIPAGVYVLSWRDNNGVQNRTKISLP
jgi:hypothetical protein